MINGFCAYGLYLTYVDSLSVHENEFHQTSSTTSTSYGVRISNTTSSNGSRYNITSNVIDLNTSGLFYGIYVSYCGSSIADPSMIVNNMISNSSTWINVFTLRYLFVFECEFQHLAQQCKCT